MAVYSEDDAESLHIRAADDACVLAGGGPPAYLNGESIIAAARATGCDAVHPGYGFLAERADFARQCAAAGLRFIGPEPRHLDLFGDKALARAQRALPMCLSSLGSTMPSRSTRPDILYDTW